VLLSAQEIALARERALNNYLTLSVACVEASQQLASAVARAGRATMKQSGSQWSQMASLSPDAALQLPAVFWLDHWVRAGKLYEEALLIAGEVQKAVIHSTDFQMRIIDSTAVSVIERARKTSPWETEVALKAIKDSLMSAEKTLHELSEAAIESVDKLEKRA
jgi:hypothetical protein